jgi:hypothetical protein
VNLDVHTMLLGALGVLLGFQMFWMWLFARLHGWSSGLLPPDAVARQIFHHLQLERGLFAGGLLALAGLGFNLWLVAEWWGKGFGDLAVQATFRYALWGFTALVLGVQTVFGSFFLTMLGMVLQDQGAAEPYRVDEPGRH